MSVTRERLGRGGLVSLILTAGIGVWDWWVRTSGLDPYFGTQKDTFVGHALALLFNSPAVLLVSAALFYAAWCIEPAIRGRFGRPAESVAATNASAAPVPQDPLGKSNQELAGLRDRIEALSRERNTALQERDDARRLLGFPEFEITILEILACDPPIGPDLFGVLIVQLVNSGAPSVARSYEVFAHTVFGGTIKVDISCPPIFTLYLNGGRDYIAYETQHYLMTRAYDTAVQRGTPVTGAIPLKFKSITNLKEVDMRSLKVTICDGTGTPEGKQQLWHSTPLVGGLDFSETVPQRVRINLPTIQPRPPK